MKLYAEENRIDSNLNRLVFNRSVAFVFELTSYCTLVSFFKRAVASVDWFFLSGNFKLKVPYPIFW